MKCTNTEQIYDQISQHEHPTNTISEDKVYIAYLWTYSQLATHQAPYKKDTHNVQQLQATY
jgi:ribosomal protein S15P/S13E